MQLSASGSKLGSLVLSIVDGITLISFSTFRSLLSFLFAVIDRIWSELEGNHVVWQKLENKVDKEDRKSVNHGLNVLLPGETTWVKLEDLARE